MRLFGPSPTLQVALSRTPVTLDPVGISDQVSHSIVALLQRSLTRADSPTDISPDLCEGWSLDVTETRYTFVLADRRWSDGVAIRPADFLASWKRHLAPGSRSAALPVLLHIHGASGFHSGNQPDFSQVGIRVVSPRVLEVRLNKPDPRFPAKIATSLFAPQRQDVIDAHPRDFTSPLHYRASGPYQPLEWNEERGLLLVANSYYPGKPQVAKLRFHFVDNVTDALQLLEKGLVDVASTDVAIRNFRHGPRVTELPTTPAGFPDFEAVRWD